MPVRKLKAPKKKLFEREWLEIVSLAQNGTSVPEIARIYKVHHSLIYRGLEKRKVRVGSLAKEAAQAQTEQDKKDIIAKIKKTKENDYRFTEFLQTQIIKVVSDTQKKNKPIGTCIDDVKTLKLAIDGIRSGTDNKWRILGLDKENQDADKVLPELPIRQLTDIEVEKIRNRQNLEDGNLSPAEIAMAMDALQGIEDDIEDQGDEDEEEDDEDEPEDEVTF